MTAQNAWHMVASKLPPMTEDAARENRWWFEHGWEAAMAALREDAAKIAVEREYGSVHIAGGILTPNDVDKRRAPTMEARQAGSGPVNPYAVGDKVEFLLHRERGICTVEALRGEKLVEVRIPNQGLMLTSIEALKPVSVVPCPTCKGILPCSRCGDPKPETLTIDVDTTEASAKLDALQQKADALSQPVDKLASAAPQLLVVKIDAMLSNEQHDVLKARFEKLTQGLGVRILVIDRETSVSMVAPVGSLADTAGRKLEALDEQIYQLEDHMREALDMAESVRTAVVDDAGVAGWELRPKPDMENMAEVLCYVGHYLLKIDDRRERMAALTNYWRIRELLERDTGAAPPITGEDAQP